MKPLSASAPEKLRPILRKLPRARRADSSGYRTRILDGNVLTGTDHRLGALRQWLNACLPGKSLVILEPDLGLISDLVLCEDAYTQALLARIHPLDRVQPRDLLVFDRNFTTRGSLSASRDAALFLDNIRSICQSLLSAKWSSAARPGQERYEQTVQATDRNRREHYCDALRSASSRGFATVSGSSAC